MKEVPIINILTGVDVDVSNFVSKPQVAKLRKD